MKKNVYMSPEMEVVELKHTTALLAGSIDTTGGEQPPIGTDPGNGDDQI